MIVFKNDPANILGISLNDVRAVRDAEGIGLHEAKRKLLRERSIAAVEKATTVEELKQIMLIMLHHGL